MDKQSLRKWARDKRKELDIAQVSAILSDKLMQSEEFKNAKNVMVFYPLKNEINLLDVLKDDTKNFYLPRIKNMELECCKYKIGDELCESCFHTQEPVCRACNKSEIDLVVVPALAVDENNYRLGYGGGYYDRFLKNYSGKTIVCIPKELVVKTIYPDDYDIKIKKIITSS